MWIDYDGSLRIYVESTGGEDKPVTPLLTVSLDLKQLFSGKDVFVGFTSGTYMEGDHHDIVSFSFGPP
jgi:hypothetical protein